MIWILINIHHHFHSHPHSHTLCIVNILGVLIYGNVMSWAIFVDTFSFSTILVCLFVFIILVTSLSRPFSLSRFLRLTIIIHFTYEWIFIMNNHLHLLCVCNGNVFHKWEEICTHTRTHTDLQPKMPDGKWISQQLWVLMPHHERGKACGWLKDFPALAMTRKFHCRDF